MDRFIYLTSLRLSVTILVIMNIIGYSGLHHSVSFKQNQFPNLSPREYRIAQGFDSAAALVTGSGIVAAAAEERFTGDKGTNAFPANAIRYCLQAGQLNPRQIDVIAHGFAYEPVKNAFAHTDFARQQYAQVYARDNQLRLLQEFLPEVDLSAKLVEVPHHLAHAASAYYVSGFNESLILVVDGMGEVHSTTVAVGRGRTIDIIKTVTAPHSLGILYGVVTLYLGFWMSFDEYKVMGLAPYGDPRRYFNQMMEFVQLQPDGTYSVPLLFRNPTLADKETYHGSLRILEETFGPPRQPEDEITQRHKDIAAALQAVLQAGLMHMLRFFKKETGQTNLCMAGGVALNCTANGLIKRSRLFNDMFIQPAAADDGTALGAALFTQNQLEEKPSFRKMALPLWGPGFSAADIEAALAGRSDVTFTRAESLDALAADIAGRIVAGQVVAWFQGRMEYGPRALGNRSILYRADDAGVNQWLNDKLNRTEFMPFAPAVCDYQAGELFKNLAGCEYAASFMTITLDCTETMKQRAPGAVHVDGTARPQIVSRGFNPSFYEILDHYYRLTHGQSILINTSFNMHGEPIALTPRDAIASFLRSGLDVLAIENFIVTSAPL